MACEVLDSGGIIAYPTDTLYGFGADATNDSAIDRINLIKGRSGPMSVIAADQKMAIGWMDIDTEQIDKVLTCLGGPKTLIVPVNPSIVSAKILGIENTLGIRIPDNDFCNKISAVFGKPLISTSVNRSGNAPMNDPQLIGQEFNSEIDLLVDSGTMPASSGSTIYQLKDNNIIILRK